MIRVLVVDDQELVRDGFALILGAQDDIEVVGRASGGAEALVLCRETCPDVVLMDIRMPGIDGLDATKAILTSQPGTRVLVLTTYALDEYIVRALQLGASGFLLKDSPRAALVAAVRAVASGEVTIDASVVGSLVANHLAGAAPSAHHDTVLRRLTPRELQVFQQVAMGRNNGEIARALHISETTVKTHLARLLAKWGARDRIRLIVLAHEVGLGPPMSQPGSTAGGL